MRGASPLDAHGMTEHDYFAGDPRTNRERMLAGDFYIADDPESEDRSRRAVRLAEEYRQAFAQGDPDAGALLADLIGDLGVGAFIKPPLYVDYGDFITLGPRVFANYGLVALDVAPITIGADSQLGPNVQLLTPIHPIDPAPRRAKLEAAKPITLGENVWLGWRRHRLPGRHHRRQHRGRGGLGRHPRPAGQRGRRRQPGPGDPHHRRRVLTARGGAVSPPASAAGRASAGGRRPWAPGPPA